MGKPGPGFVSLKGTETNVTCWLMSGTDVATKVGVGGMLVDVGVPTLKVALHASRVNKRMLMIMNVRFRLKVVMDKISSLIFYCIRRI
jgi:hypothetical protein